MAREIERLLNKTVEDGDAGGLSEELVQRLCYVLRAQGGLVGADLATALLSEVVEPPPPPPPEPPPEG